jgi:hypothetical protein
VRNVMIKVSAETREMIVWLFNKFGDRPFTFDDVSDTISPSLFERFKLNRFVIKDDLYDVDSKDPADTRDRWRINWSHAGDIIKRRKKIWNS